MASTSRAPAVQAQTQMQTFLPDDILEEIFLRLSAAADLARASAACSSFHRIVSARRFLRRLGSRHSPPVLGFIRYGCGEFIPVVPPHRSAPEARALVQAGDFTFSFLPKPTGWYFRHAHHGRVLLARRFSTKTQFKDFLVCDPLHRRYVKIPRIPGDLMASTPRTGIKHLLPVLAPADENGGEVSFRVICIVQLQLQDKFMAFVFSSCNQTWRRIISTTETTCVPNASIEHTPYYAHGCFYWMVYRRGYSLMLDTSEMKFSFIDLPPHTFRSQRAIVEASDDRLGFLIIGDGKVDLYCKNRQSNGVGAQEWQHDKLIPLPEDSGINYTFNIVGTTGDYIAFHACANRYKVQDYEYFVLDIKTLLFEKLCTLNNDAILGFPYARFPPPLALPSI